MVSPSVRFCPGCPEPPPGMVFPSCRPSSLGLTPRLLEKRCQVLPQVRGGLVHLRKPSLPPEAALPKGAEARPSRAMLPLGGGWEPQHWAWTPLQPMERTPPEGFRLGATRLSSQALPPKRDWPGSSELLSTVPTQGRGLEKPFPSFHGSVPPPNNPQASSKLPAPAPRPFPSPRNPRAGESGLWGAAGPKAARQADGRLRPATG